MGLAAIRPLKHRGGAPHRRSHSRCSGFGRYQAVETVWCTARLQSKRLVAVGLAAIRPLKLRRWRDVYVLSNGCSGFGRYQAVETLVP